MRIAKAAIVVYGKQLGRKLNVCTDKHCPVHDLKAAAEAAAHPVLAMAPAPGAETEEEAAERQAEFERQRAEHEAERQRRENERKQQFEREQAEIEAEHNRRAEMIKARQARFERIIENAPATLSAAQLRVLLRVFVNLDPYTFADDLAEDIARDNENEQRSAEEVLLATIDATTDDKLTRFALRLALTGHVGIPREGEFDFLTEAEGVFPPLPPKKRAATKKAKEPASIELPAKVSANTPVRKATSNKKKIAAASAKAGAIIGSRLPFHNKNAARRNPFGFSLSLIPLCSTRSRAARGGPLLYPYACLSNFTTENNLK